MAWEAQVPSVGGGIDPSLEAIVALRPDLVIRFGGPQDVRTTPRLDDLGIPHLAIRPDGIEDVLGAVTLLGRLTGHGREADSVAAEIRSTLDEIRNEARNIPEVRIAYVLGGSPPWVAGPGTYIDELIRLAGGTNVFSDLGTLYGAVSPEEFVARRIDVILVPAGSTFDRALARGTPVQEVDPDLEIPGPDVARAALSIARILRATAATLR
jgi:iron complex transport system substrate-binding protein